MAAIALPESLPDAARHTGGARNIAAAFRTVSRDPLFVGAAAVLALAGCVLFVYIAMSSFVFQTQYALSSSQFSFVFAANSLGIMCGSRVNALALRVWTPMQGLTTGLAVMTVAVAGLVGAVQLDAGLWGVLVPLWVAVACVGVVFPNTTAIALIPHPLNAGTASALLGTAQFGAGAVAGPLASVRGATAVAMSVAMGVAVIAAQLVLWFVVRPAYRGRDRAPMG